VHDKERRRGTVLAQDPSLHLNKSMKGVHFGIVLVFVSSLLAFGVIVAQKWRLGVI
jgi:hypothetical protein